MQVIASWSKVEFFMLDAYVRLLGGPADEAAAKFIALNSAKAKREAIQELRGKVPEPLHKLFDGMLVRIGAAQKGRDKLCHWVWGFSPGLEDHLLIIDPRKLVRDGPNASNTYCIDVAELERMRVENNDIAREGPTVVQPPPWPLTMHLVPEGYPPYDFDENGDVVFKTESK